MQQIHFLVTDFDGTYTNTHDVVSEPSAKSSDSPFIKELIQGRHGYKFAGVFGCTHRNTDGFYGFMQTSSWGVSAPAAVLINQKIAAIQQRLADHCCANGVAYYGTSTEYDASGIFTGAELVIAAEETSNNDKDLHHHRKLRQNEKNEQLRQIIEYISSLDSYDREKQVIIHFYDDKDPIHDAVRQEAERLKLSMPENMTLKSYLYRYTTIGNTPAPIERNNFKGAVALVDDAAIARAMAMKESGRIIGSRDVAAEQQQRHHMTSMFSAPEAGDTIPPLSSENGSKCAIM